MEAKFDALIAKIDFSLQDLHRAQGEASFLRLYIMHVLFSLNKDSENLSRQMRMLRFFIYGYIN
jgi:predicted DNA-binding ribbon-helix-helix protein